MTHKRKLLKRMKTESQVRFSGFHDLFLQLVRLSQQYHWGMVDIEDSTFLHRRSFRHCFFMAVNELFFIVQNYCIRYFKHCKTDYKQVPNYIFRSKLPQMKASIHPDLASTTLTFSNIIRRNLRGMKGRVPFHATVSPSIVSS